VLGGAKSLSAVGSLRLVVGLEGQVVQRHGHPGSLKLAVLSK
jgi:hypothetical protein